MAEHTKLGNLLCSCSLWIDEEAIICPNGSDGGASFRGVALAENVEEISPKNGFSSVGHKNLHHIKATVKGFPRRALSLRGCDARHLFP